MKRYLVVDDGTVHAYDGPEPATGTIREHSQADPNNLRLWFPTGYITIRPDDPNQWTHLDQQNPITVWAGPKHR